MARPKPKSFKKRLEERVLDKLLVKPSSIGGMAEGLGENYHTVRRIFKELEDQGLLYITKYEHGSGVYKLTDPDPQRKNNSIPMVKGNAGPIKMTAVLKLVGQEDKSSAAQAARDLPRTIVRLFMAALRYSESNGKYDVQKNLKNIRMEIETNIIALESVLGYYKALLQADVFWDDFKIKAIPYDHEFDRDAVVKAYNHYYPED